MDKHMQLGTQGASAQQPGEPPAKEQPSKEHVREWLRTQIAERRPPPDPAAIRRELGWELIKPAGDRKR